MELNDDLSSIFHSSTESRCILVVGVPPCTHRVNRTQGGGYLTYHSMPSRLLVWIHKNLYHTSAYWFHLDCVPLDRNFAAAVEDMNKEAHEMWVKALQPRGQPAMEVA